jgi:hypothetical protein
MKHTCPKGKNPTHTRIGSKDHNIYGGSYIIEGDDLNKFYDLYYDYVFNKGNKEYLTEKQIDDGLLCVDLDFRYCYEIEQRQHHYDHIELIICSYLDNLKEFYNFQNYDKFKVFVMEKPNVNRLEDKSLTKDGIHIMFGLNMPHKLQIKLRECAVKDVSEAMDLPLTNTWDNVFDEGISKGTTNWQLFGSRKPANEAYKITYAFECVYDGTDGEFMMNPYKFELASETFKELSIRSDFKRPDISILRKWIDVLNEVPNKQTKMTNYAVENDETDTETSDTDLSEIDYLLMHCIQDKMCGEGDHTYWVNIAQIIKNEKKEEGIVSFVNWTNEYGTENKKEEALIKYTKHIKYTPLSNKKRLTIATLHKYAKECNPTVYAKKFKFEIKKGNESYSKYLLENVLKSEEYLKQKTIFEKDCFKLNAPLIFIKIIGNELNMYKLNDMIEYCRDKFPNFSVMHKLKVVTRSFFEIWRDDENKRQYNKLEFNPSLNIKYDGQCSYTLTDNGEKIYNNFNLFNGFKFDEKIQPVDERQSKFLDLLKYLCNDNDTYEYMKCWIASIIQNPHKKTNVAPVFFSKIGGVGKNCITDGLCRLFKGYTGKIDDIEDITKKFNNHLANKFFIYGDEICAKAKNVADKLKNVITRPTLNLENKGYDAIPLDDFSNYLFTHLD